MIQIDMSMPECCADCPFASADLINGIITLTCMTPVGRKMYAPDLISRKTRPEWCPLKEQEPVEPLFNDRMKHFVCPNCSLVLDELQDDYCPSCGKRIAWGEYYIHEDETEGR